jgi:protein SCO1
MKTKYLFCCAAMFLLAAITVPAEELSTNAVRHCCCQAPDTAVNVLPGKSLYQLDAVWTNDYGQPVQLGALKGRPQIVVMFFASCQYACPLLVSQMKQLEAALPSSLRTNVGFTLISFDTRRDKPAALKNYRAQHDLSPANWTLLTGDADAVQDVAAVLGVKYKEDAQGQFSHSNLITLLNAQGEIVYQQAGLNPESQEFVRRIEKLTPR